MIMFLGFVSMYFLGFTHRVEEALRPGTAAPVHDFGV